MFKSLDNQIHSTVDEYLFHATKNPEENTRKVAKEITSLKKLLRQLTPLSPHQVQELVMAAESEMPDLAGPQSPVSPRQPQREEPGEGTSPKKAWSGIPLSMWLEL